MGSGRGRRFYWERGTTMNDANDNRWFAALAAAALLTGPVACSKATDTESEEQQESSAAEEEGAVDELTADELAQAVQEELTGSDEAEADVANPADTQVDGPSLPGLEFPSFGAVEAGRHAYFPTQDSATKLQAGEVDGASISFFRGDIVSVDAEAATATVKDIQGNEYPVSLSYIIQAESPVETAEAGAVYVGNRFNRGELVVVMDAEVDEFGEIQTAELDDDPGDARGEELAHLVPVTAGGPGSYAACNFEGNVGRYKVLRAANDKVLAWSGSWRIEVIDAADCTFMPLTMDGFAVGDAVTWFGGRGSSEGTIKSTDASTASLVVEYPWGEETREATVFLGAVTENAPAAE